MTVEIDTTRCPVCDTIVSDHEPGISSIMMGGLRFHPNCAQVAAAESGDRYEEGQDDDSRWALVNAETRVLFEGEWTTWGELAGNEKMECQFNSEGILVGDFPFGAED
jgi:hypothetical protein